jgi:hypothetical protein
LDFSYAFWPRGFTTSLLSEEYFKDVLPKEYTDTQNIQKYVAGPPGLDPKRGWNQYTRQLLDDIEA